MRSMAGYDEDGWNDPGSRNGEDVSIVGEALQVGRRVSEGIHKAERG
jgi:hypothetical protein